MNFKKWLLSESMAISDALQVLELEPGFTEEQLKTAFRQKQNLHHPDRGGDLQASIDVNTAYAILKNSLQKAATTALVVGSRRWEELKDADHNTLRMWGLDPDKKHTVFDIHAAEEEYQQEIKDSVAERESKRREKEDVPAFKKEVNRIYKNISSSNVISAIMIFKTEQSLIDNYEPYPTDTRGNYESHDSKEKKAFEKYSKELKAMRSESPLKLRKILFNFLVEKFIKKPDSLINPMGVVPMKDNLKPWREMISFLKQFDINGDKLRYVDWRQSTLSDIATTFLDVATM